MLERASTQVSPSPNIQHLNLQCTNRNSSTESCAFVTSQNNSLAQAQWSHIGCSLAKYHAMAPTKPCLVEVPLCEESICKIERHTSLNVFGIVAGFSQRSKLLKKQLLRNTVADVWLDNLCIVTSDGVVGESELLVANRTTHQILEQGNPTTFYAILCAKSFVIWQIVATPM